MYLSIGVLLHIVSFSLKFYAIEYQLVKRITIKSFTNTCMQHRLEKPFKKASASLAKVL